MRRLLTLIFATLLMILTAAACSDSSGDSSDDGAGTLGGPCLPGYVCDDGLQCYNGRCIYETVRPDGDEDIQAEAEKECSIDEDCPLGEKCVLGECVIPGGDEDENVDGDGEIEEEIEIDASKDRKLEFFPTEINFGAIPVGQQGERKIVIRSAGESAVNIQEISVSESDNPGNVFRIINPQEMPLVLESGEELELDLELQRGTEGVVNGYLKVISDDSFGLERHVAMYSLGWSRVIMHLEPSFIEFGLVVVGNETEVQVGISNNVPAEEGGTLVITSIAVDPAFEEVFTRNTVALPMELASGESGNFITKGHPVAKGEVNGRLYIYHNDYTVAYPLVVDMHVIGVVPEIEVEPQEIDFGAVKVGQESATQIMIYNRGGAELNIASVTLEEGDADIFLLDIDEETLPIILQQNESAPLGISFKPDSIGEQIGRIGVSSNDSLQPDAYVDLAGLGIIPPLDVFPQELDFGPVAQGVPESLLVVVTNNGDAAVNIENVRIKLDNSFTIASVLPPVPTTLEVGQSMTITVTFTPNHEGAAAGQLAIELEGQEVEFTVNLTGYGIVPEITIEFDTENSFIGVQVLPEEPEEMTEQEQALWIAEEDGLLVNSGTAPLVISEIYADNLYNENFYAEANGLPVELAPGESHPFTVRYAPRDTEQDSAHIWVCSTAANANGDEADCDTDGHRPKDILLVKSPVDPYLMVDPSTVDFTPENPLPIGSDPVEQVVYIRNVHSYDLHIESIELTGSAAFSIESLTWGNGTPADCFDGCTLTGVPGEVLVVNMLFAPTEETGGSLQSAAIIVRHDDKDADRTGSNSGLDYPEFNIYLMGNGGDNTPPYAVIQSPPGGEEPHQGTHNRTAMLGDTILLSGADSYDDDSGDQVSGYAWTLAQTEGCQFVGDTNVAAANIVCDEPGEYVVNLVVTDLFGDHSLPTPDSKLTIKILQAPVAVAYVAVSELTETIIAVGADLALDGSESYDQDGGEIVAYRWFIAEWPTGEPMLWYNSQKPTHAFLEEGEYAVYLEVEDNDGLVSENEAMVRVSVVYDDYVRIELTWSNSGDMALHYIMPGGGLGGEFDCNAANPTPNWESEGDGYGTPRFTKDSQNNGLDPEEVIHENPGDGSYRVAAYYTESTTYCYWTTESVHYENDCDKCGCNSGDFGCWWCASLDMCCKACDVQEPKQVCLENPAGATFRIYINDNQYPNYTLNGSSYSAEHEGDYVDFNLIRINGVYQPLGSE